MTIDLEILHALSEAFGPPGDESQVRDLLRGRLAPLTDEVWTDVVGNLFALKRAKGESRGRVLVTAHMDEAALMVMQVGGDGLLSVRAAGKTEARGLLGQVVHLGPSRTPGVIGVQPVHLTPHERRQDLPDLGDLTVDIGVDSKDEAAGVVKRGDYAVPAAAFGRLGPLVKGKALDNRAGLVVALALLEGDYPCDLYIAFTAQEGVGARGARVAAYAVEPDLALVVDGVGVDELPDEDEPPPDVRLGEGPVLVLSDTRTLLDRGLSLRLQALAEAHGIPYQVLATRGETSDARGVQAAGAGIPTALVGLPIRYPHLPVSLAHPDDLEAAFRLLQAALSQPG
ncbi:MAG: M42 family peptidase [Anaerolineae bacterium]|nr:M42 family peptidase [Anaerolineae bacterium]